PVHGQLLRHALAAVSRNRVRNLVAEHRGEARVVTRDRHHAGVHGHLATGQAERVDLRILDDLELPLIVLALRRIRDATAHARDLLGQTWVGTDLGLAENLL